MKHLFTILLFCSLIFACDNSEPTPDEISTDTPIQLDADHTLSVYENLTNDANADALQAQIINTNEKSKLNIYGTFGADNKPLFNKISTITSSKENNDTTLYLLIDPSNGKLQTTYMSIKGINQPAVFKHSYTEGNNQEVLISAYEYDWEKPEGKLLYEGLYEHTDGITKETPIFGSRTVNTAGLDTELSNGLNTALGGLIPEVYPKFSARISGSELVLGGILAYLITDYVLERYFEDIDLPALINDPKAAEIIPSKNPPPNSPIANPTAGENPIIELTI